MKPHDRNLQTRMHVHKKRNRTGLLIAILLGLAGILPLAASTGQDGLPGMGVQPVEYFYTGKPYDADSEGYTFMYRNYDPELNRWTTVDPSGFPDGANNQLYAPSPTFKLDPLGLETKSATYSISVSFSNKQSLSQSLAQGIRQGLQLQDIDELLGMLSGQWTANAASDAVRTAVYNLVQSQIATTLTNWESLNVQGQYLADCSDGGNGNPSWSSPDINLSPSSSGGTANSGINVGNVQIGTSITSSLKLTTSNHQVNPNSPATSADVSGRLNAEISISVSGGLALFKFSGNSTANQFLGDISGTVYE